MGRVLYLIVRQGVNGYVVPINTSASTSKSHIVKIKEA